MIKVAAFTGGITVPSARFRVRQYIPALYKCGVYVKEFTSVCGQYPPYNRFIRPFWAVGSLVERIPAILSSYRYDITFLQREMISTFATLEQFTGKPRVFDVDDAIWLHRNDVFSRKLAKLSSLIICGNTFIADKFSEWNDQVVIVPTAVDTTRFLPASGVQHGKDNIIIGWSGTSGNFSYLYGIEKALHNILETNKNVLLRIVADKSPSFSRISRDKFEYIPWSSENEVQLIQGMDIGIMPLDFSDWSKGKCSYKMLLYMACSIPVIVTSVGMNAEVLNLGDCGYGVTALSEWEEALQFLIENKSIRIKMGVTGREIVEKKFSVEIVSKILYGYFLKLI